MQTGNWAACLLRRLLTRSSMKMSNWAVYRAVYRAVRDDVDGAAWRALGGAANGDLHRAVNGAMHGAVDKIVRWAVNVAVERAVRGDVGGMSDPTHPALADFLREAELEP